MLITMNVTYVILVHVSVLTVLCMYVSGGYFTWFEAQTECRNRHRTIAFKTDGSSSYFWTGFYKRRSPWIKIMGCYQEHQIQSSKLCQINLKTTSPGLCQEKCLEENISVFAVQANKCICLSRHFNYSNNLLPPSKCSFACNNSELLLRECGGESAYNVFLTDLLHLKIERHCLSLQCDRTDPRFLYEYWEEYLLPLCLYSNNLFQAVPWRKGIDNCKSKGSYPIGNVNLSNVRSACDELNNVGPRWIGVVRDQYIGEDEGQLIQQYDQIYFQSCEQCMVEIQNIKCSYQPCYQNLSMYHCSENTFTGIPSTVDVEWATLTNVNYTKQIGIQSESLVVKIVVPVVVVLLLSICAVVVGVYYIRKKNSLKKNRNIDQNYSDLQGRLDSTAENQYDHLRNVVYENSLN